MALRDKEAKQCILPSPEGRHSEYRKNFTLVVLMTFPPHNLLAVGHGDPVGDARKAAGQAQARRKPDEVYIELAPEHAEMLSSSSTIDPAELTRDAHR
jgi:hypothetical protein